MYNDFRSRSVCPTTRSLILHTLKCCDDFRRRAVASSSAWLPLLYDTVATGLTLYRTIPSIRNGYTVTRRLLEDGLIYYTFGSSFIAWFPRPHWSLLYSTILAVTLVLTIMIIAAPDGLKNICAQSVHLPLPAPTTYWYVLIRLELTWVFHSSASCLQFTHSHPGIVLQWVDGLSCCHIPSYFNHLPSHYDVSYNTQPEEVCL